MAQWFSWISFVSSLVRKKAQKWNGTIVVELVPVLEKFCVQSDFELMDKISDSTAFIYTIPNSQGSPIVIHWNSYFCCQSVAQVDQCVSSCWALHKLLELLLLLNFESTPHSCDFFAWNIDNSWIWTINSRLNIHEPWLNVNFCKFRYIHECQMESNWNRSTTKIWFAHI